MLEDRREIYSASFSARATVATRSRLLTPACNHAAFLFPAGGGAHVAVVLDSLPSNALSNDSPGQSAQTLYTGILNRAWLAEWSG